MRPEPPTVGQLLESLKGKLEPVGTASAQALSRKIIKPDLQVSGLALTGFPDLLDEGKIQVFSESELLFLERLPEKERQEKLRLFFARSFPCLIVTSSSKVLDEICRLAEEAGVAVLLCRAGKFQCLKEVSRFLSRSLAEKHIIHGVLMNINGVGVLIIGESGIGKSEVALDLISRGHVFVADDVVEIYRDAAGNLIGSAPEKARGFMEVRGLGIIKVEEIFGAGSVMPEKRIDIAFELCPMDEEIDRLYIKEYSLELLGTSVPLRKIPVAPGRNIAIIIEVATKLFTLQQEGKSPLREFLARLGEEDAQS